MYSTHTHLPFVTKTRFVFETERSTKPLRADGIVCTQGLFFGEDIRGFEGRQGEIFRRRSEVSTDDKTADTRYFLCASAQGASPLISTKKAGST